MPEKPSPYLSVVVTARNDDHGGNLLGRMQTFVNALIGQSKRFAVPLELILVEWNPPSGKPPLAAALQWPEDCGPSSVRIIQVPAELHRRYQHADTLPLYQMIAKNVGIRRARGAFVLATNIDILFSDELFQFLARQALEPGKMYRIDRYDTASEVPVDAPVEEQLAYANTHLLRINTRDGTFGLTPEGLRALAPEDIAKPDSGLSFGPGWFAVERYSTEVFRWVDNDAEVTVSPGEGVRQTLCLDLEPGPGVGYQFFRLEVLDELGTVVAAASVERRTLLRLPVPCAAGRPYRFRLRVLGGGRKIAEDPRTMNFRVFRCGWDVPLAAAPLKAGDRVGPVWRAWNFARRGVRLVRQLRRSQQPLRVGLPIPPRWIERLRPRVEGGGISIAVDPKAVRLVRRPWRRRPPRPPAPPDIVDPGTRLFWGAGWYPLELYKGETFRWAQDGAELAVYAPPAHAGSLVVLAEPGPALGYQPFQLLVRDRNGRVVATAVIEGRRRVYLPLPWLPGRTQVFTLHCQGGGPPRTVRGEPRKLWFRFFRCGFEHSEPAPAGEAPDIDVALALAGGWGPVENDPDAGSFRWVESGAELVLGNAAVEETKLHLDVGPGPETSSLALALYEGEELVARHLLEQRELVSVSLARRAGSLRVLRLLSENGEERFRVFRCGSGEPPSAAAAAPAAGPQAAVEETAAAASGPEHLHTNACGDFTLLARQHWFDLRGYPEFDLFSMNLDSVFCYSAHHGGAREEILPEPMRIYHIEHATGSGWTPEGQAALFQRIAAKGIGWIDYHEIVAWAGQMQRLEAPMIFNHENWGLADQDLPETQAG